MKHLLWRLVHLLPERVTRRVCDMCAELPADWRGMFDASEPVQVTGPPTIYTCPHMSVTGSHIVAGSIKAPCGCAMQPRWS